MGAWPNGYRWLTALNRFSRQREPAAFLTAFAGGGQVDYILFVLMRYWVPTVLPPAGRERVTKGDSDYWLESEHILKAAAARLRELKPLIELLTTPSPLSEASSGQNISASPVAELNYRTSLKA